MSDDAIADEERFVLVREQPGPVISVAVHSGHRVREELLPLFSLSEQERRRDEDPMTGYWTAVGDVAVLANRSRFEVDLNRSVDQAVYLEPEQAWGLQVWQAPPNSEQIKKSLALRQQFYQLMQKIIEDRLATEPAVLLLDIHSYNHRRDGAEAEPADPTSNPDIDLGYTTFDPHRWANLGKQFQQALASCPVNGKLPEVGVNIRYQDGGHFPEWVHATFDNRVCTITVEYKKIYMDEWNNQVDLQCVDDLRAGLAHATAVAREILTAEAKQ